MNIVEFLNTRLIEVRWQIGNQFANQLRIDRNNLRDCANQTSIFMVTGDILPEEVPACVLETRLAEEMLRFELSLA